MITQLRGPRGADAECSLVELGEPAIPMLIDAYARERDAAVRASLVRVLWQTREPSVMPALASALLDADSRVWKQALDGIVTLGGHAAVETLAAARETVSRFDDARTRREWIDEAAEQVREAMSE